MINHSLIGPRSPRMRNPNNTMNGINNNSLINPEMDFLHTNVKKGKKYTTEITFFTPVFTCCALVHILISAQTTNNSCTAHQMKTNLINLAFLPATSVGRKINTATGGKPTHHRLVGPRCPHMKNYNNSLLIYS